MEYLLVSFFLLLWLTFLVRSAIMLRKQKADEWSGNFVERRNGRYIFHKDTGEMVDINGRQGIGAYIRTNIFYQPGDRVHKSRGKYWPDKVD